MIKTQSEFWSFKYCQAENWTTLDEFDSLLETTG